MAYLLGSVKPIVVIKMMFRFVLTLRLLFRRIYDSYPNADKPQQSESKSLSGSGSSFKSEKVGFDFDPDPDFDRDDLFLYQNVCVLLSFKLVRAYPD